MRLTSLTALSLLFAGGGHAIVWRADLETAPETVARAEMRNIVRIHFTRARFFGGCGVQLTDRWVLTAKHAAERWKPSQLQLRRDDARAAVKRIVLHPDAKVDIALLELTSPLPVPQGLALQNAPGKAGERLWLGGFGKRGPAGSAGKANVFTAGHNLLERVDGKRGKIVLDPPGERSDPAEVLPTRFDSGSPVFIARGGEWLLFGITVTASNSKNPNYGDRSHHQLLAPEREWLDEHVPDLNWSTH